MKKFFLILLLLLNSCDILNYDYIEYPNLLEEAYEEKSLDRLDKFIEQWQSEYPAVKNEEISNDTIRMFYQLFQKVVDPELNTKLKNDEEDQFIIMEPEIHFIVTDSLWPSNKMERDPVSGEFIYASTMDEKYKTFESKMTDFRPMFPNGNKGLFLEGKYAEIISDFLPSFSYLDFDEKTRKLKQEEKDKKKFLRNRIQFNSRGKRSYPRVTRIRVNSDFSEAYIDFNFPMGGDIAHLMRISGKWKIVEIENYWVI